MLSWLLRDRTVNRMSDFAKDTNVPTSDCISRQAALDALEEPRKVPDSWTDEYAVGERAQYKKDVKALNSLPSAERREAQSSGCEYWDSESNFCTLNRPSAERRGTWTTRRTMEHDGETYCDQCGWTWEDMTHGKINVTRTPFCPNCGARMRMTRE